jgi:hypothetical protein
MGFKVGLLTAVALATAGTAWPVTGIESVPGVHCRMEAGVCRFEVGSGVGVAGPPASFVADADGRGFAFDSGEERLVVRLCDPAANPNPDLPCVEAFQGILRARIPAVGFLANAVTPAPPRVAVAFDTGANLATDLPELGPEVLGILKDDSKYYVYYSQTAGLDAQFPGVDAVRLSSGADRTLFVFAHDGLHDPEQSLVYFEGKLPGLAAAKPDPDAPSGDGSATEGPQLKIGLAGRPAFAFVPAETAGAEAVLLPFQGQLMMQGPVPLSPLVELDGTTVWNLDPDEDGDHPFAAAFYQSFDLEVGGNGVARIEIPLLDVPSLEVELSRAAVAGRVSEDDDRLGFSGWASDRAFLPGLPIPIRPRGEIRAYGQVSRERIEESFLHAEGALALGAAALGRLVDVPLADVVSGDAVLHLDAAGLLVSGTTASQIHPDVVFDGAVGLEVYVAGAGGESYLELRGRMVVGGTGLEDGVLRVSPRGVTVRGVYRTGLRPIVVEGRLDASGYRLTGSTELEDPLPGTSRQRAEVVAELAADEEAQRALESAVAEGRAYVSARRQEVETALGSVNAAQATVDHWAALLATYTSRRAAAYASYVRWTRVSCAWYDLACQSRRAANVSYYWSEYTYYKGLAATAAVSKAAADAVLAQAKAALSPLQLALTNGESALALLEAQLDAAIQAVQDARDRLDAIPDIGGTMVMVVTLTLHDGEASGSVVATWNDAVITDGWVDLGDPGRACVRVPGGGEVCSAL